MKSVKPGRGPSMMGGCASLAAVAFGVIWMLLTNSIGAPLLFTAFGGVFVLMMIGVAIYNFANATGKRRFSAFDITDDSEEPDPLNERFGDNNNQSDADYCPYCGTRVEDDYRFCKKCGRELPE